MSFACPSSSDATCSQDSAVNILRKIFGDDYVNAFLMQGSQNPALVGDPNTVMSIASSYVASLSITAAILIIVFNTYKWFAESSYDGEAVGLSERSGLLGFFGRPVFSLIMLAPTASGYPLIHIVIMTLILWSNGAANTLYTKFASSRIMPIGSDMAFLDNPAYLKANSVGRAATFGALHGYCAKVSDTLLQTDMKMKVTTTAYNQDGSVSTATQKLDNSYSGYAESLFPSRTEDVYSMSSASGIIPSTTALCGTFVAKNHSERFFRGDTPDVGLDNRMAAVYEKIKAVQASNAAVSYKINNLRRAYAGRAYYEGFLLAYGSNGRATVLAPIMNGSDKDISKRPPFYSGFNTYESGWVGWNPDLESDAATAEEIPSTKGIIEIQNRLSATLNQQVNKVIIDASNRPNLKNDAEQLRDSLLATGWINAGNTQSIIRRYTSDNVSGLFTKVYDTTLSLGIRPEDLTDNQDMLGKWSASIDKTQSVLLAEISRDADNAQAVSDMSFEADMADLAENPDGKFEALTEKSGSFLVSPLLSLNETLIETMTGTSNDNNVDALYRMQSVGETFVLAATAAKLGSTVIKTAYYAKEYIGVLSGVAPVVGEYTENVGEAAGVFRKGLSELLLDPIEDLADSITNIGRVFSVVIPSMPYIFLLLAAVGWLVQIIQTMFGMPLWLVMHSIPEKSFIGSQQQGYVTALALFFRPILIISAFFLSYVIYDPIVTLFTQGFSQVQANISGGTATNAFSETLIFLTGLRYWWYLYAAFLMMITYYVFGLVQELGDSVLDWVGTNLLKGFGNLNTDSAMKNAEGGMARNDALRKQAANQRAANDNRPPNSNGGGGNGGGGGGNGGGDDDGGGNGGGGDGSLDSVVETRGNQDTALGVVGGAAAASNLDGDDNNHLSDDLNPYAQDGDDNNQEADTSDYAQGMTTTSSSMNEVDGGSTVVGGIGDSNDLTEPSDMTDNASVDNDDDGNINEFSAVAAGATASAISDFVGNPIEDGNPVTNTDPDTGSVTTTMKNSDGSSVSRTSDADGNLVSTTASRTNPITRAVASRTENSDGSVENTLTAKDGSYQSVTTDKDDNVTQSIFDGKQTTTQTSADANGDITSSSTTQDLGDGNYRHTETTGDGTSVTFGNANTGSMQSTLHETNPDGTVGAIIGDTVDVAGSGNEQSGASTAITGAGLVAAGIAGAALASNARNNVNTADLSEATDIPNANTSTSMNSGTNAGTGTPNQSASLNTDSGTSTPNTNTSTSMNSGTNANTGTGTGTPNQSANLNTDNSTDIPNANTSLDSANAGTVTPNQSTTMNADSGTNTTNANTSTSMNSGTNANAGTVMPDQSASLNTDNSTDIPNANTSASLDSGTNTNAGTVVPDQSASMNTDSGANTPNANTSTSMNSGTNANASADNEQSGASTAITGAGLVAGGIAGAALASNTGTPNQSASLDSANANTGTGTPNQSASLDSANANTGTPNQSASMNSGTNANTGTGTGTPNQSASMNSGTNANTGTGTGTPNQSASMNSGTNANTGTPNQSASLDSANAGTGTPNQSASMNSGTNANAGTGTPNQSASMNSGTNANAGTGTPNQSSSMNGGTNANAGTGTPNQSSSMNSGTNANAGTPNQSSSMNGGTNANAGTGTGTGTPNQSSSMNSGTNANAGTPNQSSSMNSGTNANTGTGTGTPNQSASMNSGTNTNINTGTGTGTPNQSASMNSGTNTVITPSQSANMNSGTNTGTVAPNQSTDMNSSSSNQLAGGNSSDSVRMFGGSNSTSSNLNQGGVSSSDEQLEQVNRKRQSEVSLSSGIKSAQTRAINADNTVNSAPEINTSDFSNATGSINTNSNITQPRQVTTIDNSKNISNPNPTNPIEVVNNERSTRLSEGSINNPQPKNHSDEDSNNDGDTDS